MSMSGIQELREVLPLLDNAISTEEMREMNYKVDVEGMTTQEVAHEFLVEKGSGLNICCQREGRDPLSILCEKRKGREAFCRALQECHLSSGSRGTMGNMFFRRTIR